MTTFGEIDINGKFQYRGVKWTKRTSGIAIDDDAGLVLNCRINTVVSMIAPLGDGVEGYASDNLITFSNRGTSIGERFS